MPPWCSSSFTLSWSLCTRSRFRSYFGRYLTAMIVSRRPRMRNVMRGNDGPNAVRNLVERKRAPLQTTTWVKSSFPVLTNGKIVRQRLTQVNCLARWLSIKKILPLLKRLTAMATEATKLPIPIAWPTQANSFQPSRFPKIVSLWSLGQTTCKLWTPRSNQELT